MRICFVVNNPRTQRATYTTVHLAFAAYRLGDFDVIFLRNSPSAGAVEVDAFNPALDCGRRLKQLGVLVVNDPDGLSRAGSKMYLAGFPVELRPKTLITRSVERVRAFLRELDGPAII